MQSSRSAVLFIATPSKIYSGFSKKDTFVNLLIKTVAGGVSVLTGRRVVRVDPVKQEAVLHDGTVIRQDRVQSSAVKNVSSTLY